MLCSRVKNLLSAYCDRELGGDEMLAIRRHLGDCPDCRQEHESYQQLKQLFRSLNDVVPERQFEPSLLAHRQALNRRPSAVSLAWANLRFEAQDRFDTLRHWSRRMFPTFHTESQVIALACVSVAVVAALALQRPRPADAVSAHVPETFASDYVDGFPRGDSHLAGYGAPNGGPRLGVIGPDGRIYLFRQRSQDPATDLNSEPYWRSPVYDASLASHRR